MANENMRYRVGDIIPPVRNENQRAEGNDAPSMTFDVRFSSETEVPQYSWTGERYNEVLSHNDGDYDFSYIRKDGMFLESHDSRDLDAVLGKISNPRVVDKESIATVELDPSHERSVYLAKRIENRFIRNVSVGWMPVEKIREDEKDGTKVEYWRWQPHEISLVSVGADRTSKVLRERQQGNSHQTSIGETNMETDKAVETADSQLASAQRQTDTQAAALAESMRLDGIKAAVDRHRQFDGGDIHAKARELVTNNGEGKDLDAWVAEEAKKRFDTKVADNMQRGYDTGATGDGEIGLSRDEAKKFNFARAANDILLQRKNPMHKSFELDVLNSCRDRVMKDNARPVTGAHSVPGSVHQRIVQAGSGDGANFVATELSEDYITYLYPMSPLMGLVRRMTGLVGNQEIPRQNATVSPAWRSEVAPITAADPGEDKIALSPKMLGVTVAHSRLALQQSVVALDQYIRADMDMASLLAIHWGILVGGATNGPVGVTRLLNAASADRSSQSAGSSFVRKDFVDVEGNVEGQNALEGSLAYVMNAGVKAELRDIKVDAGSGRFLVSDMNEISGYPVLVANQIEDKFAYASSKANYASSGTKRGVLFGNWNDVILASWISQDLIVDEYTQAKNAVVEITLHNAVDVAVRHIESFHALVKQ